MSTTATRKVTQSFQQGMEWGERSVFRAGLSIARGEHYFPPGEEGVIEVIQNLIYDAKSGKMTEEQLRRDVGIVIGYAITHPHSF